MQQMCTRCGKRPAVIFVTKLENGVASSEGLCISCAMELKLPQISKAALEQMGISEEEFDQMQEQIASFAESAREEDGEQEDGEEEEGRAPSIDFGKFLSALPFFPTSGKGKEAPQKGEAKDAAAPDAAEKEEGERADFHVPRGMRSRNKAVKRKMLEQYCLDLTKRAKEGKLDRIVGREKELARLLQILLRRQKNNPCLIGEPGVGKTAIAEALAEKIAAGEVPFRLREKEVHLVDLTALVAGTQFRGQFESRMKGLIEEVKALGNIILVIDEIHNLVGAGDAEGSMNAANILKPALSRGEIQVIGATTLTEYRKFIEKDAALERRFQPITVGEPSIAASVEILQGIKGYYEEHHGLSVSDALLDRIVRLSERYITDRFLPDKAIDLLDEAASYAAMHAPVLEQYAEAVKTCTLLEEEKKQLESKMEEEPNAEAENGKEEQYRALADLKTKLAKAEEARAALEVQRKSVQLTLEDIAHVIEIWTGVPAGSITEQEFRRVDALDRRLKEKIVGQDAAVDAVSRAIKRNRAGITYQQKPVSFIFAGPTGVGKTALVKALAEDLFDSPETLIRLDMSEFMEKHSVSRIIGAPPGYVGYDDAGQLTEKIRRKPYSVVLFDEIEKAHPDVLNILLQILDEGKITDAGGRQINFENTVIVMTTNAGATLTANTVGFGEDSTAVQAQSRTQKALEGFLRPEFLNRVDEIITFRSLTEADLTAIAKIMLEQLQAVLQVKGVTLMYEPAVCSFLAKKSYSRKYGARNMHRFIQTAIEDSIANEMISRYEAPPTRVEIAYSAQSDQLQFRYA